MERLRKWGAALAPAVLQLAESLPPEEYDRMLGAALGMANPQVRLAGLQHLRNRAVAARAALLRAQPATAEGLADQPINLALGATARKPLLRTLFDPDSSVRAASVDVHVKTRDHEAVGPLASVVEKEGGSVDERKLALRALCSIGGKQAMAVLRGVLQSDRADIALRIDAAHALGGLRDDESRAALLAVSGKFFVNRALKDACVDAIKKLVANRAANF